MISRRIYHSLSFFGLVDILIGKPQASVLDAEVLTDRRTWNQRWMHAYRGKMLAIMDGKVRVVVLKLSMDCIKFLRIKV